MGHGNAEKDAIGHLWMVIYGAAHREGYSEEAMLEAIRSLGTYVHHEEAVGHLWSVVYGSSRGEYPKEAGVLAIRVLGKRLAD
jgi:hypothetical protein